MSCWLASGTVERAARAPGVSKGEWNARQTHLDSVCKLRVPRRNETVHLVLDLVLLRVLVRHVVLCHARLSLDVLNEYEANHLVSDPLTVPPAVRHPLDVPVLVSSRLLTPPRALPEMTWRAQNSKP